jgi:hypothetical protein
MIFSPDWSCTADLVGTDNVHWYLVTAGHCVYFARLYGGSTWSTNFFNGGAHLIGSYYADEWGTKDDFTGDDGDYGSITISNPSGWQITKNSYLYVGPSPKTTENQLYRINSIGHQSQYSPICATSGVPLAGGGGGYFTACGQVKNLGVNSWESDIMPNGQKLTSYVKGLGESDACDGTSGASGGPYFKDGVGFGIMSADSSNCDTFYQGMALGFGNQGLILASNA